MRKPTAISRGHGATLTLSLAVTLWLPAALQAQFTFTTNNGAITITQYNGLGGAVTIPDTINGLPVTSIGSDSFAYCDSLTSVTIPGSVSNIGDYAFSSCTNLTSVIIPGSVANFGEYAFSHCTGLTNVMIQNGVASIGINAFWDCTSLTSVTIPDSVTSIGDFAFNSCASLPSVTIPSSVTNIGLGAFFFCSSLTAIGVDVLNTNYGSLDGVLFDKNYTALLECPGGKAGTYIVPNGVISITDEAFISCASLTGVTIPGSVTNIGMAAFVYCSKLTAIGVDVLNTNYGSLDGVLFDKNYTALLECPGGKAGTYVVPNGVAGIAAGAFDSCASLTSVTIPGSVTNIGNYAFFCCTKLTNVTLENGVTTIGEGSFAYCGNLRSIVIPGSVNLIWDAAFNSCSNLTGIYFRGNAPGVGFIVFWESPTTAYYLSGTTGWSAFAAGIPVALWLPQIQTGDGSFGVQTNQFGFEIRWASDRSVVVEACTNLASPVWSPVATNILTGDSSYFCDPQWTNYPSRLYRLRSP